MEDLPMLYLDYTFDLFMEDCNKYNATPQKGVYPSRNASDREKFMTWFKNQIRDFREVWRASHTGDYDRFDGWIGDYFLDWEFGNIGFSDYYKDTYGHRPHAEAWYYIHAVGLPMSEDISRTFCMGNPMERAIEQARNNRLIHFDAE